MFIPNISLSVFSYTAKVFAVSCVKACTFTHLSSQNTVYLTITVKFHELAIHRNEYFSYLCA